jgi:hypothetical protein
MRTAALVIPGEATIWIQDLLGYLNSTLKYVYDDVSLVRTPSPEHDNYIIDGFVPSLNEIVDAKRNDRSIFFVPTEWLNVLGNKLYLNCFSSKERITSDICKLLRFTVLKQLEIHRKKNIVGKLTSNLDRLIDTSLLRTIDQLDRAQKFFETMHLIDGIVGATERLVTPYALRSRKPAFWIEPIVPQLDVEEFVSGLPPTIYHFGRMTKFRSEVIRKLTNSDKNTMHSQKIGKIAQYKFDVIYKDDEMQPYGCEMYIPQKRGWPHSSPIRTLMSLQRRNLPLHLTRFNDIRLDRFIPVYPQLGVSDARDSWVDLLSCFNENINESRIHSMHEVGRLRKFLF